MPTIDKAKRSDFIAAVRGLLYEAGKRQLAMEATETEIVERDSFRIKSEHCPMVIDKLHVEIPKDNMAILGGGGIVFRCLHSDVNNVQLALKITRLSLYKENTRLLQEEVTKAGDEFRKGLPLSHQNIAKTLAADSILLPPADGGQPTNLSAIMLSEWVDGAKSLHDYLFTGTHDYRTVFRILLEIMAGLEHLHRNKLVHWDIKADNILASANGEIKIMDLGNARYQEGAKRNRTDDAQTSLWNLPPCLSEQMTSEVTDVSINRIAIAKLVRESTVPWLDLWMVAKELNRYFMASEIELDRDRRMQDLFAKNGIKKTIYTKHASEFFLSRTFPHENEEATYCLNVIRLILKRLLRPQTPAEQGYYATATNVIADLEKVIPEHGAAEGMTELQAIPQHSIRIACAIQGNDVLSRRFRALIDSPPMIRLKRHQQLATVSDVYPGATHTRFEHSIGVFAGAIQYIRSLYADKSSRFWKLSVEREDVEALLIAALFHDVGHYSFSHYVEDVNAIFGTCKHEDYVIAMFDPERKSTLIEVLRNSAAEDRAHVVRVLRAEWGLDDQQIAAMGKKVANIIKPEKGKEGARPDDSAIDPIYTRVGNRYAVAMICHSVMDSLIDTDKLDYLVRDAHHIGVKYCGGIDERRFFETLSIIVRAKDVTETEEYRFSAPTICVTAKGILPVLSILTARFFMFTCVYWHKTVRAETAMLQHVIISYIATHANENAAARALNRLVGKLLINSERESITVLSRLVRASRCDDRVVEMCSGLGGDRSRLFKMVYEFNYSAESNPAMIFTRIDRALRAALGKYTPWKAAKEVLKFNRVMTRLIADQIKKAVGVEVVLDEHDLLVDVPPPGKEHDECVFVKTKTKTLPIQMLNPLARAVDDCFRLWARTLRVFISRSALDRCRHEGIHVRDITDACRVCFEGLIPQGQLPLFADTEDADSPEI